jgi:small conductance mechanosensitive channel
MTQEVSVAAQMFTNIAYAIIILAIGFWGAKMIARLAKGLMERRDADQALTGFVGDLVNALVVTFAVIAALNKVGIQTTSLVAIVGAAGLAIGLALKDSLGNFAAGVMILVFSVLSKPSTSSLPNLKQVTTRRSTFQTAN